MQSSLANIQSYESQLHRLFIYYCSFGDKDNYAFLKMQNYQRLFTDMQIINDPSLIVKFDLLFYSHSHQQSSLTFKQFTQILPHISSIVFPDVPAQQQLIKLLSIHIRPLHDYIVSQTDFGRTLSLVSASLLKQNSFKFISRFQKGLLSLYTLYFPQEGRKGQQQQFKFFSKLSRDLNLCPRVVSKPVSYIIFLSLTRRISKTAFYKQFSTSNNVLNPLYKFSFLSFVEYLIILSHINNPGEEKSQIKIYQLLQQIELSKGCQTLGKTNKFQHFFMQPQQLQQAINQHPKKIAHQQSIHQPIKNVDVPIKKQLGHFYDPLKLKFVKLCAKKNAQSNFYMSPQTIKRLLVSLCPKLTETVLQNMISSVENINFQNFIAILAALAQKMGITAEKLYETVALYDTEQFNLSVTLANLSINYQEDCGFRDILKLTRSYLRSLYQFYEVKGILTLTSYLRLFQQTNVCPMIVTAVEVIDIFRAYSQNAKVLMFQQFLESLIGIIVSVHFQNELQGVERLLYLLQKICSSKRGQMLMKKNILLVKEHPLYKVRVAYEEVYKILQTKLNLTSLNNIS